MRINLTIAFCSLLILCLFGIFLRFGCASEEKEFQKALDLLEAKDYSRAIEILEPLISEAQDSETKSKNCYVAATCYRKMGRWLKAIPYYQSALGEDEFMFADLAKLYIATGYQNLLAYRAAIKWYEMVLSDHSDGFSVREARYQIGECYFLIGRYEAVVQHYKRFIEDYPGESRVRMAEYKMGRAYQKLKNWSEAYVIYQGMLRRDMKDEMARNILDDIRPLMLSHPAITVTRDDRIYYGLALYYAKRYKLAREELRKVIDGPQALKKLEADTRDDLSAKAAYFIAESYYQEKEYSRAIKEYTSVAGDYPGSEYAVTAQHQIALCYWKAGREEKANGLLAKFAEDYPESDLADNALFQIAENHMGNAKYKEAADAYGEVVARYPDSSLADDAFWNMGWCYVKLSDNGSSENAFRQLVDEYPESTLAGAARFWKGVTRERSGKWQAAADAYRETMQNGNWYYSDRARRRLDRLAIAGKIPEDMASVQYNKVKIDDSNTAWQNIYNPIPSRAQELLNLRIFDDAAAELLMAVEVAMALESVYYNLSICYKRMGDINNSWRYAWRLSRSSSMMGEDGSMPRQLHEMLYPIAYRDAVMSNSGGNDLDPFLILAVMYEESRYNPAAVSWAGARGLMQIMPRTGGDIAQRLSIRNFRTEMLHQPELNIRMGTWYLAGSVKRLGDHVKTVLAGRPELESEHSDIIRILALGAYHAGESRVRRWVNEYGIEDIDQFVENIPIYDTKRYIKKVCDSYELYRALYGHSL